MEWSFPIRDVRTMKEFEPAAVKNQDASIIVSMKTGSVKLA